VTSTPSRTSERAAPRFLDQRLELLRRVLLLWRGFDDRHEMELVVLAPSIAVKAVEPPGRGMQPARVPRTVDGSEGEEWVVGRLGSLVVLASLALAFVAVALTTLKA
jgi:hypothetical protein